MVFGAERQVRDEVGVHDVEVDPIGAARARPAGRRGPGSTGRHRGCSPRPGARPPAVGSLPRRPAGDRLVDCARRAGRAALSAIEPRAPPGDRRGRRLAGPLRGELAAAAPTSWPRLRRMVVWMPAARSVAANASMTGIGLALHGRVRDRVHRDQVDVGVIAAQQVGHRRASASVSLTPPIIVTS